MIRIDPHVKLGGDCAGLLEAVARARIQLLIAEVRGKGCLEALPRLLPMLNPRVRVLVRTSSPHEVGLPSITAGEYPRGFKRIPEILHVDLRRADLRDLKDLLAAYPNRVRVIEVDFKDLRELYSEGKLDLEVIRRLGWLGLKYHAPLLIGSGAERRDEVLHFRVLSSPLRALLGDVLSKSDYKVVLNYLLEKSMVGEWAEGV